MESLYETFKIRVKETLKPLGYKKYGATYIQTAKELKNIINIQHGRFSTKDDCYAMINLSYHKVDDKIKNIRYSDFYEFRHDDFNKEGYTGGGYRDKIYPTTLCFKSIHEIGKAINILKKVEKVFRCDTKKELIEKYKKLNLELYEWVHV